MTPRSSSEAQLSDSATGNALPHLPACAIIEPLPTGLTCQPNADTAITRLALLLNGRPGVFVMALMHYPDHEPTRGLNLYSRPEAGARPCEWLAAFIPPPGWTLRDDEAALDRAMGGTSLQHKDAA